MNLRKVAGKLCFVFTSDRNIGAIEVRQFRGGKRQRRDCGNGPGDPTVTFFFLRDLARGVGGSPGFSGDHNVAILVGASVRELIAKLVQFLEKIEALRFGLPGFLVQGTRVGPREPFGDGADGAFQLLPALQVTFEDADAQRAQLRNDVMADHTQRFRRVAGNQNTFSLRQQMPDKIADGVGFAGAGRTLHQHASVLFQLLGDANLFGIGGLAQENFRFRLGKAARGCVRFGRVSNGRFFAHDVQERPRQIFASAQVRQDAFDGGGETQRAGAQKDDRIAANARIVLFAGRRAFFDEFASRRELHDKPSQKRGGSAVEQRMESSLFQFLAAATDRASIHVGHRLEESGIKLDGIVGLGERELGNRSVKLQLKALQENGVENSALRALPTQNAISHNELDAFGLAIDAPIEGIKSLEDAHGRARGLFGFRPLVAKERPASKRGKSPRIGSKLGLL